MYVTCADRCASCEQSRAAVEDLTNQVRALHKQNQSLQEQLQQLHGKAAIHTLSLNDSDICLGEDSLFENNALMVSEPAIHTYIHTYIHTFIYTYTHTHRLLLSGQHRLQLHHVHGSE